MKTRGLSWQMISRTVSNKFKYGWSAPAYGELIWIPTAQVSKASSLGFQRSDSGKVTAFSEPCEENSVFDIPKIAMCLSHWRDGVSWDETGIVELIMQNIASSKRGVSDGLRSYDDVVKRYAALDKVFETVKREGRLRTRKELVPRAFKEEGGILIHLDASGEPIFGGGGHHRLAIAIAAGIECFPAKVGVVHPAALTKLPEYRSNRLSVTGPR